MTPAMVRIVEDEAVIRAYAEGLLARAGYRVTAAPDGESGLGFAETLRPDSVVLDAGLPGVDGFEVCRRLRGVTGGGPAVLFCSGDGSPPSVFRAFEAGASGYVLKPFEPEAFLENCRSSLKRAKSGASGRGGYALVSVLVLTAVLGLIAGVILRSRLQASQYESGNLGRVSQDAAEQSALNAVSAAWALAGASCASGPGVSCSGSGCSCACVLASGAKVTAKPATIGSSCQLAVSP